MHANIPDTRGFFLVAVAARKMDCDRDFDDAWAIASDGRIGRTGRKGTVFGQYVWACAILNDVLILKHKGRCRICSIFHPREFCCEAGKNWT